MDPVFGVNCTESLAVPARSVRELGQEGRLRWQGWHQPGSGDVREHSENSVGQAPGGWAGGPGGPVHRTQGAKQEEATTGESCRLPAVKTDHGVPCPTSKPLRACLGSSLDPSFLPVGTLGGSR